MKISLQHIRDVDKYFSSKQYDRAIDLLDKLVKANPQEYSLRMKLADACYLYGKSDRAVQILKEITVEHARNGFITKAMALQKKIQRIDPSVDLDIYSYIEEGDEGDLSAEVASPAPASPQQESKEEQNRKALDGLFSGLPKEEFHSINSQMSEVSKQTGEDVFQQGDEDNSLYVIISGGVKVHTTHKDRAIELARLREGAFFGEVALLTGKARTATVTCLEESIFLVLSRQNYLTLAEKYPGIRKKLAAALESRAQNTIERIIQTEMES